PPVGGWQSSARSRPAARCRTRRRTSRPGGLRPRIAGRLAATALHTPRRTLPETGSHAGTAGSSSQSPGLHAEAPRRSVIPPIPSTPKERSPAALFSPRILQASELKHTEIRSADRKKTRGNPNSPGESARESECEMSRAMRNEYARVDQSVLQDYTA